MWYTTKANTGDNFTPVVVSEHDTEVMAEREAQRLHQEQCDAVDEAGTNMLPFAYGVFSKNRYNELFTN